MKMSSFAKKLVAGIVSVAMAASMAVISTVSVFAADGTFSLSADKAAAGLGDEVVATVNVTSLKMSSANVVIKYDDKVLEPMMDPDEPSEVYVELVGGSKKAYVITNAEVAGQLTIGYIYQNDQTVDGGFLAIHFTVKADAPKTDTAIELVSVTDVAYPNPDYNKDEADAATPENPYNVPTTLPQTVEVDPAASTAEVAVDGVVEVKPISLTVDPASAKAGETVSVTVNMDNITFGSLMLEVTYDADALDYVATEEDILAKDDANNMTAVANAVNGKVVVSAMASPNATINGPFVVLQFKVKEGATVGDKNFSLAVTEAYQNTDAGVEDITAAVQEATATGTVSVKIEESPSSDTSSDDTSSDDTSSTDTSSDDNGSGNTGNPGGNTGTPGGNISGGNGGSGSGNGNGGGSGSGNGNGNGSTPAATGNTAPIAVIAFLSVIALAGVVVFAKKGMTE